MQSASQANKQERMGRASQILRDIQQLNLPNVEFDRVGPLNDMQRLLQTLVNTAHVENKSHSMLARPGSDPQIGDVASLNLNGRPQMMGKCYLIKSTKTHFLLFE